MPFCENCGTKLSDAAKFCPNCGHKVGNSASVSGQDNPVTPAPSVQPSKYEIVGYLAAYAKELLSLQKAVRRLFPCDKEVDGGSYYKNGRKITTKFENGSLVLHDEITYTLSSNKGDSIEYYTYTPKSSCMLLDWSSSPHLQREAIVNQRIKSYDFHNYDDPVLPTTKPISECPETVKICSLDYLPIILTKIWILYCDEIDRESVLAMQEKLKIFFSRIGDASRLFWEFDRSGKNRYESDLLDWLYELSSLDFPSFISKMKKEGLSRITHELLWLEKNINGRELKKYETMPAGFFNRGKASFLCDDRILCSALADFIKYFPDNKSLLDKYLPAVCDVIEEKTRALDESFSKRFWLPPQYRSPECAVGLARLLLDGKADTWKEAMILFDTEKYRETVIRGLGSISGQIALLNQQVKGLGAQTSAILGELKTTNIKLSSISTSTFITAVFGDD